MPSSTTTCDGRAAATAVNDLLKLLPPLDVGDPRAFIAAAVAIFASYPASIYAQVLDPVHGLPSETARPTLADIKRACKRAYEPRAMELARERAAQYAANAEARDRAEMERTRKRADRRRAAERAEVASMRAAHPGAAFGLGPD
jgi:hypothetical protein